MRPKRYLMALRDSQFTIPAAFIAISLLLAFLVNRADSSLPIDGLPFLLPSTVPAGRTMLATIAGAVITVAALVFSFTAVTVQLATSQYSPRVIQEFLRDRFQQVVIGVVMGTFTFSLVGLATLGADPTPGSRADWTATVGVIFGVGSALLIVAYIDHVTRRIDIDDTIDRLSAATQRAFEEVEQPDSAAHDTTWDIPARAAPLVLRARHSGWVQSIDVPALAESLTPGSVARLDRSTGQHVAAGTPLMTVWSEGSDDGELDAHMLQSFSVGGARTIDRDDPGFGVRQLVDIALRALSPGINDPATAADVVRHLVGPIRAAYLTADTRRTFHHPNGTRILAPGRQQPGDYVRAAFSEIRMSSATQPTTLLALAESLSALRESLQVEGLEAEAVQRELRLVAQTVQEADFDESVAAPILRALDTPAQS